MNREIYATITNRFIEKLKEGTVPWQKPWLAAQNIISRKPYQGINALLLGSSDFKSPFWLSFKQALDLGGHVKKGEKSTPVIYYKFLEKRDDAGNLVVRENGRPITDSVRSLVQCFQCRPDRGHHAASHCRQSKYCPASRKSRSYGR